MTASAIHFSSCDARRSRASRLGAVAVAGEANMQASRQQHILWNMEGSALHLLGALHEENRGLSTSLPSGLAHPLGAAQGAVIPPPTSTTKTVFVVGSLQLLSRALQ